ncbi:MAG TPA: hypothetical protein VI260_24015 [Blastocatellia bacterium]|jgi:hypothetical protein
MTSSAAQCLANSYQHLFETPKIFAFSLVKRIARDFSGIELSRRWTRGLLTWRSSAARGFTGAEACCFAYWVLSGYGFLALAGLDVRLDFHSFSPVRSCCFSYDNKRSAIGFDVSVHRLPPVQARTRRQIAYYLTFRPRATVWLWLLRRGGSGWGL